MSFLGIDAGASATKWVLIKTDGSMHSGKCDAMDGHLYRDASMNRMKKVMNEILDKLEGTVISSVFIGITGVTHDGSIEREIKSIFNCPATVISDIELAYRANFANGEGILLYAGTGSVAFTIDAASSTHQIGGWGYLLGDEGAGYWIGREGIRHALFNLEAKKKIEKGSLSELILSEIQANDWNSVKSFVYSRERSEIAALSRIVNTSAELGDKDGIAILVKAAGHLAELISRTDNILTLKSLPVKFTGGMSSSKILYQEIEKYLSTRVSISTVDIALRAAEMAR